MPVPASIARRCEGLRDGPLAGLPVPGVLLIFGVWLAWEGVRRKPPRA